MPRETDITEGVDVVWTPSQDVFINEKDGISRARKRRKAEEAARAASAERTGSRDADLRTPRRADGD